MNVNSSVTPSAVSLRDVPTQLLRRLPWELLRRPEQIPPSGDWLTWLILAGRGWGKTRTGAEWVQANIERYGRWILAGATAGDLRDIMVEGESGILRVSREHRPHYEPSKARLTWPNGAIALLLSADEPDRFRGKQAEAVWADELAAWRYPESWDQLQLGLRLGSRPRQVVTTTPRPTDIIRGLMAQPDTVVTQRSTYDNRANLAPDFFRQVISRYEGTRIGLQELHAQILTDVPGALWTRAMIAYGDAPSAPVNGVVQPVYQKMVVAIDPAVTYGPDSDETGIVVGAVGSDGYGYVIDDRSGRYPAPTWAKLAVALYHEHKADRIVAESNNGGEMVGHTIHTVDSGVPVTLVTATRGKRTRAEPIAALYEQGRIKHLRPFTVLEDQLCNFTPDTILSPDRLDALVWAFSELMLDEVGGQYSMIA